MANERHCEDARPDVMQAAEAWGLRFLAGVFVLATLINAFLFPITMLLFYLAMGVVLGTFSYWGSRAVLSFQRLNALTMKRETYDTFVKIVFVLGLWATFPTLFFPFALGGEGLLMLYWVAMPVGICLGAAQQWSMRERFQSRRSDAV